MIRPTLVATYFYPLRPLCRVLFVGAVATAVGGACGGMEKPSGGPACLTQFHTTWYVGKACPSCDEGTCAQFPVNVTTCGSATCVLFETPGWSVVPGPMPGGACTDYPGLTDPDPSLLQAVLRERDAAWRTRGAAYGQPQPSTLLTCQLTQLVAAGTFDPSCTTPAVRSSGHYGYIGDFIGGSCAKSAAAGWCYVKGTGAGTCRQSIVFSAASIPAAGSTLTLICDDATCTP